MEVIKVILDNPWYNQPWFIAIISSLLTGFIFALVLQIYHRRREKKDLFNSLNSELTGNYKSIEKIQGSSAGNDLKIDAKMIAAIRKNMPWNKDLSDQEIFLIL